MDTNLIITIGTLLIGYIKFKEELNHKTEDIKRQMYKDVVLAEKVKRNRLIIESMTNLLSHLNLYGIASNKRGAINDSLEKLEEKYYKEMKESEHFQSLYINMVDENEELNKDQETIMLNIYKEFYYLSLVCSRDLSQEFKDLKNAIDICINENYVIEKSGISDTIKLNNYIESIEKKVLIILEKIAVDDWEKMERKIHSIFEDK